MNLYSYIYIYTVHKTALVKLVMYVVSYQLNVEPAVYDSYSLWWLVIRGPCAGNKTDVWCMYINSVFAIKNSRQSLANVAIFELCMAKKFDDILHSEYM